MKRIKKNRISIGSSLAGRIPYRRCHEEEGIIETQNGRFTRMYRIHGIDTDQATGYDPKTAQQKMAEIINGMPEDIIFQFVIHNRFVDADESRMQFLVDPDSKEEVLRPYVEAYDRVVLDNAEIGHNNTRKRVYCVLSVSADTVDDAARRFKALEPELQERFDGFYGIRIEGLGLVERLEVLYAMFNPYKADFGKKIDLSGSGQIDLGNLKYMHMTTKDLVAPVSWNTSKKLIDYSILDEKDETPVYVRAFYVGSVPERVSSSFVGDITSVSSQMVLSMLYEPVDDQIGFHEASEAVSANTEVMKKNLRDTIADRRARAQSEEHADRTLGEETYFHKAALRTFRNARAGENRTFFCTFTVILYGESLEALDKNTELLHLSAAKFSASVNALDLQQCEGFQTTLPLCESPISCGRVFSAGRLSAMSPVGIQDAIRRNGLYCGINAVNDNLVLLNRKNNIELSGLISGTDHPGCTYQMKREAFSALIGTDDRVHIITTADDYEDFVGQLNGEIKDFTLPDIFQVEEGYGLLDGDYRCKGMFLEALFSALNGTEMQGYPENSEPSGIEAEVGRLVSAMGENGICDGIGAIRYLEGHQENYPCISEGMIGLIAEYGEMRPMENSGSRLTIHRAANTAEILIIMDRLWNNALSDKHNGVSNWIFIDRADDLLRIPAAADYLVKFLQNASLFQTVVTIVLGETVKLIGKPATAIALESVVEAMGYVKLLNQGPVERKKYAELLDIPNALLPYISNVEPGKGIIITPSGNVAFNDNWTELYPEGNFRKLFSKEVEQIRFDGR